MIAEARLEKTARGVSPKGEGWFVLHASEACWLGSERFGLVCNFEGEAPFPEIGVNIRVIQPGQPASLYHQEGAQENFLVLAGECLLLVEEQERRLKAGHFVHCPPWTRHVFVGAGERPCAILMIGHRPAEMRLCYPASELAAKHGSSAEKETTDPREAYGRLPVFDEVGKPVWPLW